MNSRRVNGTLTPISPNIPSPRYALSKVGALDDTQTMDERTQDDVTQGSGSIVSGVTSLDDDTDEFGLLLRQQAKDEQRMRDALQGRVQPFSRARPSPRAGLTLQNLERNNALQSLEPAAARQTRSSGSISGSDRSDPPVHVPRQWGRKARPRNDWLRRISDGDGGSPGAYGWAARDVARDVGTDGVDWAALAEMPLPTTEGSPLANKSTIRGTPSPNQRLDQIREWEEIEDLTVGSIIASTPAMPRNTKLDDIIEREKERELESVKDMAVTTHRLDKFRENAPDEISQRPSSSRSSLGAQPNGMELSSKRSTESLKRPSTRGTDSASIKSATSSTSPIVLHKSAQTIGAVDHGIQASGQTNPRTLPHRRSDSHDLLRRLARVTSLSPSPRQLLRRTAGNKSSSGRETRPAASEQKQEAAAEAASEGGAEGKGKMAAAEKADDTPEQRPADAKLGASVKPLAQAQHARDGALDQTPAPALPPLSIKTPVVTGAWVDTPGPAMSSRRSSFSSASTTATTRPMPQRSRSFDQSDLAKLNDPDRTIRKPKLPKSALAAVVDEVKSSRRRRATDDAFGDATIESLEDLVSPTEDLAQRLDVDDVDEDTLHGLQVPPGEPKTEAERLRRQEVLELQTMNARLKKARISIRDAKRGMRRMEREADIDLDSVFDGKGVCRHCGHYPHPYHDAPWMALWRSFRNNFWYYTDAGRLRFTWFGLAVLIPLTWYITEISLCEHFHPTYAVFMHDYGVRFDVPPMPWITLWFIGRPFEWLYVPAWRWLSWTLGVLYTYFQSPQAAPVRQAVRHTAKLYATRGTVTAFSGMDLSMNDDEVI